MDHDHDDRSLFRPCTWQDLDDHLYSDLYKDLNGFRPRHDTVPFALYYDLLTWIARQQEEVTRQIEEERNEDKEAIDNAEAQAHAAADKIYNDQQAFGDDGWGDSWHAQWDDDPNPYHGTYSED